MSLMPRWGSLGSMTSVELPVRWGAYDRTDPFPVFRAALDAGPVHEVTLRDGHPAWLVVGYHEARAALNDPRFSKDMHAALATGPDIVDEGLPGPAFARSIRSTASPHVSFRPSFPPGGGFRCRRRGLLGSAWRTGQKGSL